VLSYVKPKLWELPYYKYKLNRKQVVVDVTASIPAFDVEIDGLSDVAAEFRKREFTDILDFGAGKLRNSFYLTRKGFKVRAVEFKEAFDTPVAKKRLARAERSKGLFILRYPTEFLEFSGFVDAIILVNVANVVPEPSDRDRILKECAARLKKGGLLLWMSQHGEPHYRPGVTQRLRLNDGWCYGLHRRYQSFYREYKIPEIRSLVPKFGFTELRKITSNHNWAFLFERT
jgi:SAM-dependent methyltransferase